MINLESSTYINPLIFILLTLLNIIWLSMISAFIFIKDRNRRKEIFNLQKKIILADHDIKTLHFNQKLLHSNIKELRKDLTIYGEVKRSKVKEIIFERPEE